MQNIEDLAAHIHSGCVEMVFKIYNQNHEAWKEAWRVSQMPATKKVLHSKIYHSLRRCEPNSDLDSGTLHLLDLALPRSNITKVKMALAKVILFPSDGMLLEIENNYASFTNTSQKDLLWQDDVCPRTIFKSMKSIKLDAAYCGMRRIFFNSEERRQKQIAQRNGKEDEAQWEELENEEYKGPKLKQKNIFLKYWILVQNSGGFDLIFTRTSSLSSS